ncbi:paraflagellar rod protein, putative, partial [Bodo saltans]
HEEGAVQAARERGGGARDAEGEAEQGPGGVQGVRGGPGRRWHRVQPPRGREQRGGADPPQQDGGVPRAPVEAGGGEDCRGARGDQAREAASQRRARLGPPHPGVKKRQCGREMYVMTRLQLCVTPHYNDHVFGSTPKPKFNHIVFLLLLSTC